MITPNQIIKEVVDKFKITEPILIGPRRNEWYVRARREAVKRLKDELNLSWNTIGSYLNRDHSAIIHLYKTKGRESIN